MNLNRGLTAPRERTRMQRTQESGSCYRKPVSWTRVPVCHLWWFIPQLQKLPEARALESLTIDCALEHIKKQQGWRGFFCSQSALVGSLMRMNLFLWTVLFLAGSQAYAHLVPSFFPLGGPSSQIQANETRITHKAVVLSL